MLYEIRIVAGSRTTFGLASPATRDPAGGHGYKKKPLQAPKLRRLVAYNRQNPPVNPRILRGLKWGFKSDCCWFAAIPTMDYPQTKLLNVGKNSVQFIQAVIGHHELAVSLAAMLNTDTSPKPFRQIVL